MAVGPWDIWKPSPSGKLYKYIFTEDVTAFELNATNVLSVYIQKVQFVYRYSYYMYCICLLSTLLCKKAKQSYGWPCLLRLNSQPVHLYCLYTIYSYKCTMHLLSYQMESQ